MTVTFPVVPRGTLVTPHLIRTGGDLVSTLGGPTQRITRLGSRYAADIELPSLDAACAALWLGCALHAEAMGDTLALVMPQMLDASHLSGVTGSGAAASAAVVYTGPAPDPGMWFSFRANGRHYLHLVTSVDLPSHTAQVGPLLRTAMPAGTPLEFLAPVLEGYAADTAWSLEYFRFVGHKFTITESA
jgi:hypothetical protein